MLKPGGTKNKNISLEKMKDVRKISKNTGILDLTKVKLGALFDDSISNQDYVYVSDVILDKPRYWIEIKGVPVRSICTQNDHIVYIDHNSEIKVTRFKYLSL